MLNIPLKCRNITNAILTNICIYPHMSFCRYKGENLVLVCLASAAHGGNQPHILSPEIPGALTSRFVTVYCCVTCSLVFRVIGLGGIQGQGLNAAWLGCRHVREGGPGEQGTVSGWGHAPGASQALPAASRSVLGPSEDLRCQGEVGWGREHPASWAPDWSFLRSKRRFSIRLWRCVLRWMLQGQTDTTSTVSLSCEKVRNKDHQCFSEYD